MSRIHHVRKGDKAETSCGLKLRNMRATKVPMEATCGVCVAELRKKYNEETAYHGAADPKLDYNHEVNVTARNVVISSARAWWQNG